MEERLALISNNGILSKTPAALVTNLLILRGTQESPLWLLVIAAS